MKAVIIRKYGPVNEVVEFSEAPAPKVGPQDVLIEVSAASVNPIDHLIVKGYMQAVMKLEMPTILGNDVAGVVIEIGSSVTRFKKGDEVFSRVAGNRAGTFAEMIAVDESLVAKKPSNLSFAEAASLPLVALTAYQALVDKAELKAGQTVLIHAGSGGVGSAAIQIAKSLGAKVITTSGTENVDMVRALGADVVIDYKTQRFEDGVKDVDVVFDTLGGETQARSYGVLKSGGILVSIVGAPDAQAQSAKYGVRAMSFFMSPNGAQLEKLGALVLADKLKPVIDRSFPLAQTQDALLYSQSGRAKGKIVIDVKI